GVYVRSSGKTETDTSSGAIGFGDALTMPCVRLTCHFAGARNAKPDPSTVCGGPLVELLPPPPQPASATAATGTHAPARIRERRRGYTREEGRRKDTLVMATTKDRVLYAADTAKPYLGRAIHDEEFRDNLRAAFAAARAIYEELSRQRGFSGVASSVATDEDIHGNLRRAIKELRQAADRIQERESA